MIKLIANTREILQNVTSKILRYPATGVESPTPVKRAIYAATQAGHLGINARTIPERRQLKVGRICFEGLPIFGVSLREVLQWQDELIINFLLRSNTRLITVQFCWFYIYRDVAPNPWLFSRCVRWESGQENYVLPVKCQDRGYKLNRCDICCRRLL